MLYNVKVTQEHIDKGERLCCARCPTALALRDATGIAVTHAGPLNISVRDRERLLFGRTPAIVKQFMSDFDSGKNVQPFAFDVELGNALNELESVLGDES